MMIGVLLENPLTCDGLDYVIESVEAETERSEVVELWIEQYNSELDGRFDR